MHTRPVHRDAADAEAETAARTGPAWERLEDQLAWYDRRSADQKRWFVRFKVVQIVAAAVIPVLAGGDSPDWIVAALGALIVVLEGLQQLFQFQQNWVGYRATAEALKHEKFLYLSAAGPYAGPASPSATLAERVEGLVSQEHSAWASTQANAGQRTAQE